MLKRFSIKQILCVGMVVSLLLGMCGCGESIKEPFPKFEIGQTLDEALAIEPNLYHYEGFDRAWMCEASFGDNPGHIQLTFDTSEEPKIKRILWQAEDPYNKADKDTARSGGEIFRELIDAMHEIYGEPVDSVGSVEELLMFVRWETEDFDIRCTYQENVESRSFLLSYDKSIKPEQ